MNGATFLLRLVSAGDSFQCVERKRSLTALRLCIFVCRTSSASSQLSFLLVGHTIAARYSCTDDHDHPRIPFHIRARCRASPNIAWHHNRGPRFSENGYFLLLASLHMGGVAAGSDTSPDLDIMQHIEGSVLFGGLQNSSMGGKKSWIITGM